MSRHTFCAVRSAVHHLMAQPSLAGRLYAAGGIVPYLWSGQESGRLHSDIDLVVHLRHMPLVRAWLQAHGLYHEELDSLSHPLNTTGCDYGAATFFEGIPLSFAPFEVGCHRILQRNFFTQKHAGADALVTATLAGVALEDYITAFSTSGGPQIGAYTLEMVRCTKEKTARDKDQTDLQALTSLPFDEARYHRLKPAVSAMTMDVVLPA